MNKRQRKKARRVRVVMLNKYNGLVYFDKPPCPRLQATVLGFHPDSIPKRARVGRRVNIRCEDHPW